MEQKIRGLVSICEENAQEAVSLASKHPDLHDDFSHLVNIMHETIRKDPEQFVMQLPVDDMSSELMNFFALIGGASATVNMYADLLKILGVTHVTDKLLEASQVNKKQQIAIYVINLIRMFWVNATDASLAFAACLAEAELFPYLAEDVKNLDKSFGVSL